MFLVWSFWSIPRLAGGRSLDASFWADVHVNIVSNYGVPTLSRSPSMRLYQTDHSYRKFRARRRCCTVLAIRRDDTQYHTRLVWNRVRLFNLYSTYSLSLAVSDRMLFSSYSIHKIQPSPLFRHRLSFPSASALFIYSCHGYHALHRVVPETEYHLYNP